MRQLCLNHSYQNISSIYTISALCRVTVQHAVKNRVDALLLPIRRAMLQLCQNITTHPHKNLSRLQLVNNLWLERILKSQSSGF